MNKNFINKICQSIKTEKVLTITAVLAIISSFFITPDNEYFNYIDFRTLALLFSLMTVMSGLQETGLFNMFAEKLLKRVQGIKSLAFILVVLCFFFSMLITNDVTLITFVPFSFTVLNKLDDSVREKTIIPVIVMQTVAANLGSMLTPIGNPQNLYLHGISNMSVVEFILLMLPYTAVSFVLFAMWILFWRNKGNNKVMLDVKTEIKNKPRIAVYMLLFCVCLLTVSRILDYKIMLLIVIAFSALTDYKVFVKVDYALLLTFAAFFIFVGNIGRIDIFSNFIKSMIDGRECITGILLSQIISNVPAALLLSGFTDNLNTLIIGVNIGGLGTLIASMASLISFKFLVRENKLLQGRYLVYFTTVNVIFLAVLFGVYYFQRLLGYSY